MPEASPAMDPILAKDYPRALRDGYRSALRKASLGERHNQLLRLAEVGLAYLGSLALSDYRRSRATDPDAKVEAFLAANKKLTMGQYLSLFRLTQKALGRPEIFGIKRHEVNVRLEHAQRWVAAERSVEYAQRIGATDVGRAVEEGLKQPAKGVRWVAFWEELVTYRNRVAHADGNDWPLEAVGYYEVMTPLLERALVEALRTEYIGFVLLEYPTAELVDVRRSRDGWVQRFDGEYRGAPLLHEVVRQRPPDAWESELGCTYVLHRDQGAWTPHSRFHDLRRGVPPALDAAPLRESAAPAVSPGAEPFEEPRPPVLTKSRARVGREAARTGESSGSDGPGVVLPAAPADRGQAPTAPSSPRPGRAPVTVGWPRRAGAWLIDAALALIASLSVLLPASALFGDQSDAAAIIYLALGPPLAIAVTSVLPMRRRSGMRGQSLGKLVMNIRAVRTDGGEVLLRRALAREIGIKYVAAALTLGLFALLDYLWPLWDPENRTLHDQLTDTRVEPVGPPG